MLAALRGGSTLGRMATREDLHRAVDALSDERVAKARIVVDDDGEPEGEPGMAELPEDLGETLTGEPMPNVVAAVRRSRESH